MLQMSWTSFFRFYISSQDIWDFKNVFCCHKFYLEHSKMATDFFYLHKTPSLLPDTFPLGTATQRCDCHTGSPLKHYSRKHEGLRLYMAAVSIIEILSVCDEYNENSGVRGEWVWIIVSSVIISRRERKTATRSFFFLHKNHLHLHSEVFQGRSEQAMVQDGTVWIKCTWNMQTSTPPSCTGTLSVFNSVHVWKD